jgi:hypothetical protein
MKTTWRQPDGNATLAKAVAIQHRITKRATPGAPAGNIEKSLCTPEPSHERKTDAISPRLGKHDSLELYASCSSNIFFGRSKMPVRADQLDNGRTCGPD